MDALSDKLVDKVNVVLESVLRLLGVGDVAGVANDSLNDTAGFLGSINAKFELCSTVRC